MGGGDSKLSPEMHARVLNVFRQIDTDGSKSIDKAETLKFWYCILNNFKEIKLRKTQYGGALQIC